jgi:hypothetical protein
MDNGVDGRFWAKNKPALVYAARIVRTPYLLARGPAPEGISASGQTVTAVLDDTSNGGQGIVAAEYYVDTPPWRGGTGTPLRPADGAWGSTRETVTGTANVPWGRHTVYVRGQDSAGYWGPVQVVWVTGPAAPHQVWVPLATR